MEEEEGVISKHFRVRVLVKKEAKEMIPKHFFIMV